jgi:hypothetical protein
MTETFAAAFARHATENGYSIRKTKDLVRLSTALGLTVKAIDKLAGGDAGLLTEKLVETLTFKTEPEYWTAFRKKPGKPQVIDGVSYHHEIHRTELEASRWPHAELAIQLVRDPHGDTLLELEPNLWMGRERVKEDELRRVMNVYYIEGLPGGGFTIWVGKRVTLERLHDHSGNWTINSVEPYLSSSRRSDVPADVLLAAWKAWGRKEWNGEAPDFPYEERVRNIAPPLKAVVPVGVLAVAGAADLESLVRSCSRILTVRRQDTEPFTYEQTLDTLDGDPKPKLVIIELNGNDELTERPIKLEDMGSRKSRQRTIHTWRAQYECKNGSVARVDGENEGPYLLFNSHRLALETVISSDIDERTIRPRIERHVRGVRGEFLEEAKLALQDAERHRSLETNYPQYRQERLALGAFIEWATSGTTDFQPRRSFLHHIDYGYGEDGRIPDVFQMTVEDGNVVVKNIPFPPQEKTRRGKQDAIYSTGRVWITTRNGDGIKLAGGERVRYYLPFNNELHHLDGAAVTEARFLRYVDGYRREFLPEIERHQAEQRRCLSEAGHRDRSDWEEGLLANLEQLVEWLKQR